MKFLSLTSPAVWALLVLLQLGVVYGGAALGVWAPSGKFASGRLLENPDVGLVQAVLALAIFGLFLVRDRRSSWRIVAFVIAGAAAAAALYHWVAYFVGSELALLMASAFSARDYGNRA